MNKVDVNEQNDKALGFYLRMGFRIIGRDETDGMGKPYPILHLQLPEAETSKNNSFPPQKKREPYEPACKTI